MWIGCSSTSQTPSNLGFASDYIASFNSKLTTVIQCFAHDFRRLCWWTWHRRHAVQRRGRQRTTGLAQTDCVLCCCWARARCSWSCHRRYLCSQGTGTVRWAYYSSTTDDWVPRSHPAGYQLFTSNAALSDCLTNNFDGDKCVIQAYIATNFKTSTNAIQVIRPATGVGYKVWDWIEQGLASHSTHFGLLRRRWSDCGISQDCSRSQSPQCVRC